MGKNVIAKKMRSALEVFSVELRESISLAEDVNDSDTEMKLKKLYLVMQMELKNLGVCE